MSTLEGRRGTMSVPVWVRPRGEMGEIIAPELRSGRSVGDARIGCGIFITTEFCRARLIAMPRFEIECRMCHGCLRSMLVFCDLCCVTHH